MADITDERQLLHWIGAPQTEIKYNKKHTAALPPPTWFAYSFPQHPGGPLAQRVWFFDGKMEADCDGSPRAYKANAKAPGTPLEHSSENAQYNGEWTSIVVMKDGNPQIGGKGDPYIQSHARADPFPGFYVSTTALQDQSIDDLRNPRRYADSEQVPFVVLPGPGIKNDKKNHMSHIYTGDRLPHFFNNTQLGDLAYVVSPHNGRSFGAVVGDIGPANKAGEGSIRLLDRLGYPGCSGSNSPEDRMLFFFFPGSAPRLGGWPAPEAQIDTLARALFVEWGGVARLKRAFPHNRSLDHLRLTTPGLGEG